MTQVNNVWATQATEQSNEFPVVGEGQYSFRVKDVKLGTYKKNNPNSKLQDGCGEAVVQIEITGMSLPDEEDKSQQVTVQVFDRLYTDPSVNWKFASLAKAVGTYHEGYMVGEVQQTIGKVGYAMIIVDDYNGKKSNKVKSYVAPKNDLPF